MHIACFLGMEKPLFLLSEQYPGLWLEHVYDSAGNAIHLFIDY